MRTRNERFAAKTFNNGPEGFVLVAVIVMTLLLAVVVISFISIATSQRVTSKTVVDEIVAEQLAIGNFYRHHQYRINDCANCPTAGDCSSCATLNAGTAVNLNDKNYSVSFAEEEGTVNLTGLNDTRQLNATIDF